jgi:hypothetical protein
MSDRITIAAMTARAERAEALLRQLEHDRIVREEHDRVAREEAMTAVRLREQQEARAGEVEETRRASWLRWHTAPERIQVLAAHEFDPKYIDAHTPPSVWPPDDDEANHEFRNAAVLSLPEYDQSAEPALVREAKARGIPV